MADGDAASGIGLAILSGIEKVKDMWKQINATRDMIANHITSGAHAASAITSGTLDAARIPTGMGVTKVKGATDGVGTLTWNGSDRWNSSHGFGASSNIETAAALVAGTGIICTAVYSNILTTAYRAVYIRSDGVFGHVPSSRRFKKNIRSAQIDPAAVLSLTPVEFDYKAEFGGGHDTGLIAEDVQAAGLEFLTLKGEDGQLDGIAYERLAIGLLAVVRDQQDQIEALRRDLDTIMERL